MHACLLLLLPCCTVGMDKLFCLGLVMSFHLCMRERERKGSHIVGVGECLSAHIQLTCLSLSHRRAEQGFCVPHTSKRLLSWLVPRKLASVSPRNTPETVINSSRPLIIWPTEPCMIGIKLGRLILGDLYWRQCLTDVCSSVHSPATPVFWVMCTTVAQRSEVGQLQGLFTA